MSFPLDLGTTLISAIHMGTESSSTEERTFLAVKIGELWLFISHTRKANSFPPATIWFAANFAEQINPDAFS